MSQLVFTYGTLQVPAIIAQIVGRDLVGRAARLDGYARFCVRQRPYPAIVEAAEAEVSGVVYEGIDAHEMDRLDVYEGDFYERRELPIRVGGVTLRAATYVLRAEHAHQLSEELWDLARFESQHLASYLARIARTSRAP